jgi:hypothetical protein
MWKEEKVETVKRHKFCDDCGVEVPVGLACCKASCEYCKKDLCDDCVGHEEETGGDYRIVWCKKCWSAGDELRPVIEEHHNEIERLYKLWRDKCEKN